MYPALHEDLVHDDYRARLREAEEDRRATRYQRLRRARQQVEKANLRLHRATEAGHPDPAMERLAA